MSARVALTIAGSDASGGAGIQADLKTFSALGVYGTSAITALTAQNTLGVQQVHTPPVEFLAAQVTSICEDIKVAALKCGMLGNAELVRRVAQLVDEFNLHPLVVDPVMVAQSGARLVGEDAVVAIKQELIPRAELITPNLPEAAELLDISVAEVLAAPWTAVSALLELGCSAVLLKGGHAPEPKEAAAAQRKITDYFQEGEQQETYHKDWVATENTHGSGCTLAAAITAYLAKDEKLGVAVTRGNSFINEAIKYAAALGLGKGAGPVHHCYKWW